MRKFILLVLISFLLILQDFPQKRIENLSFEIANEYKNVVGEGQKFVSDLTTEQNFNTNRNLCLLTPAIYLCEKEAKEYAERLNVKNEVR